MRKYDLKISGEVITSATRLDTFVDRIKKKTLGGEIYRDGESIGEFETEEEFNYIIEIIKLMNWIENKQGDAKIKLLFDILKQIQDQNSNIEQLIENLKKIFADWEYMKKYGLSMSERCMLTILKYEKIKK